MRIGIVEDNASDCETLVALVARWAAEREIEVQIGSYADAASFLEARARGPFDAVLLDCYLDGRTSHGADAPGLYGGVVHRPSPLLPRPPRALRPPAWTSRASCGGATTIARWCS